MSDSPSRLPARPSLEQLQKQAKELLRQYRAGDAAAVERFRASVVADRPARHVVLADAQFVLAREHGFESWAQLKHHVEASQTSGDLAQHQQLAADLVAAYRSGDAAAIQRLNDLFHSSYDVGRIRESVQDRLSALPDAERRIADFALADAQLLVARLYGFDDWPSFVRTATQPEHDHPGAVAHGMSAKPPFYKIDRERGTLELRQPMSQKDWDRVLEVMKEQCLTGLNANGQISDDVMAHLAELDQVTRLHLGGCERLSDDGLQHLARMPQLLDLELGGNITDRGLDALCHLRELRRFQMCWQRGVSDAGLSNLRFCDQLESVDLLGTPSGDGVIGALAGKQKLRSLKTGRAVTDAGLALLHALPVFKTWQGGEIHCELMGFDAGPNHLLIDGPFTDAGLAGLTGLEGLFGLSFFWHSPAFTSAGLASLRLLPNLGFLGCQDAHCDDEAMRHIAAIPRLCMLMGQGAVASDEGFSALSRSPSIEYLWGRECKNLTGRGFAALAAMPALRGLAVSCKNVDDASLATLPRFPSLEQLMPMDVSDQGFRHVGRCGRLEALWCMYCRETGDAATEHLAGLSRLKTYYAGKTRITDRSLTILGKMTSLERLEFWQVAGISDAGVAHLSKLPRLREISFERCGVTRNAAAFFPAHVRVNYSAL